MFFESFFFLQELEAFNFPNAWNLPRPRPLPRPRLLAIGPLITLRDSSLLLPSPSISIASASAAAAEAAAAEAEAAAVGSATESPRAESSSLRISRASCKNKNEDFFLKPHIKWRGETGSSYNSNQTRLDKTLPLRHHKSIRIRNFFQFQVERSQFNSSGLDHINRIRTSTRI